MMFQELSETLISQMRVKKKKLKVRLKEQLKSQKNQKETKTR